MPQVTANSNPEVYESLDRDLRFAWAATYPSKRSAKVIQPIGGKAEQARGFVVPADVSTLLPVYVQAVVERERCPGRESPKVARAAYNLGLFLFGINKSAEAEAPLRRALYH